VTLRPIEEKCAGEAQGLVLYGYGHHSAAAFVGFTVRDPARAKEALRKLVSRVTFVGGQRDDDYVNVAFTVKGLAVLGLPAETLAYFPVELRDGMGARGGKLGDVGPSSPETWRWGGPNRPEVHVLVLLYAFNRDVPEDGDDVPASRGVGADKGHPDLKRLVKLVRRTVRELRAETADLAADGRAMSVAFVETTRMWPERIEHFGFRDGLVQPRLEGGPKFETDDRHAPLPLGELLLGHPNAYDEVPSAPKLRDATGEIDLGENGTYLVVRSLDQDVAGFWSTMRDRAIERLAARGDTSPSTATIEDEATFIAAKIVGRWPNGKPLLEGELLRGKDAWGGIGSRIDPTFTADAHGRGCPLGAHIRRANPREALGTDTPELSLEVVGRHRLVRRGRPYGPRLLPFRPDDGKRRGLVFACVGTSIRRQFEFLQQQWAENGTFQRLMGEDDPLIGQRLTNPEGHFTMPAEPWRERVSGLPRFVTTRGGGYFFLPGRRAYLRIVGGG
jgi:Dyp-type peroxidase family